MKKTAIIATSIVSGAIMLCGCTNPSTPANVAKNLEHNLTVLSSTINKLDTIDNTYLSNPDIYPVSSVNNENFVCSISAPHSGFNLKLNSFAPKPIKSEMKKIASLNVTNNLENDTINVVENVENINSANNLEPEITDENADLISNPIKTEELVNNDETKNELNNNETNNFYYYDIKPIRYNPRYVTSIEAIENQDYLSNYINKVRNLYAITSDVIEANSTLTNCKDYVLTYVVEIKDLNNAIKNGSFEPNNQQIAALNNYISDIKTTIKRIKRCNGELSDEVNSINKNDVGGITSSIDVVKSNYLKVLNHLDTRITYLKSALTTLEQVKYLLQEAQNIIENNEELPVITPEIEIPENENNVNNAETNLKENENLNENVNVNENNNFENNDGDDASNNEKLNNNETNNNNNNEIISENNNDSDEQQETNNSNIDTYENENNNLDSFNNSVNNVNENEENVNEPNNLNNTENIETNENTNPKNETNNNGVINNGTNLNGLNSGVNNGINGAYGVGIGNVDEDRVNTPNGVFQNGIITQNNLNNGVTNGVNGYGTGTGDNNLPYTPNGMNQTNKNVDTYGYNTMIDMINRGTVNNGINTLNLTEEVSSKPSMVNAESENDINDEYSVEFLNETEQADINENEVETEENNTQESSVVFETENEESDLIEENLQENFLLNNIENPEKLENESENIDE